MRGRIVLFIVLAVAAALAAAYLGVSAGAPKAAVQPPPATTASSPPGSGHDRTPGPGPTRSPTAPSPHTEPKTGPPAPPPPAPTPKAGANPGGTATPPPATKPQPSTGPVRFGKVTVTPSGDTSTLDVAPSDYRALTANFSDRVVQVAPGSTEPVTRSFAMTLPLTDGAKGETLRVSVQGFAHAQEGAYAQLTLKLNGLSSVRYYPNGWEDDFDEVLEAPATPATTYRLEGVLEVHQKPGTGGAAYLNVSSVDASIER